MGQRAMVRGRGLGWRKEHRRRQDHNVQVIPMSPPGGSVYRRRPCSRLCRLGGTSCVSTRPSSVPGVVAQYGQGEGEGSLFHRTNMHRKWSFFSRCDGDGGCISGCCACQVAHGRCTVYEA